MTLLVCSVLGHYKCSISESSQEPYVVSTIIIIILQMKMLTTAVK